MKFLVRILSIAILAFLLKSCIPSVKNEENTADDRKHSVMPPKSANDKIVIVKGINYQDIHQATTQFCRMYNKDKYQAIPYLTSISDYEYAVTFPHNLSFDMFCYFVNYINFPENLEYKADIKGWTSTTLNDTWVAEKSAGKRVMVYVQPDLGYDNVLLSTHDGFGYKIGFAVSEGVKQLKEPILKYTEPDYDLRSLQRFTQEEIK